MSSFGNSVEDPKAQTHDSLNTEMSTLEITGAKYDGYVLEDKALVSSETTEFSTVSHTTPRNDSESNKLLDTDALIIMYTKPQNRAATARLLQKKHEKENELAKLERDYAKADKERVALLDDAKSLQKRYQAYEEETLLLLGNNVLERQVDREEARCEYYESLNRVHRELVELEREAYNDLGA